MAHRIQLLQIVRTDLLSTKAWWLLVLLLPLAACSSAPVQHDSITSYERDDNIALLDNLLAAEEQATDTGRSILATGREMTLVRQEIVRGSCWDYSNAVYDRAGYPNDRTNRDTVFKGTKKKGPYADAELIQPGDWLFYINHSYNDIEHSAIFVKWLDFDQRTALMLSYGGEKRNAPARYLPYDLSHVYRIIRPAGAATERLTSAQ